MINIHGVIKTWRWLTYGVGLVKYEERGHYRVYENETAEKRTHQ